MSEEFREFYYHQPYHDDGQRRSASADVGGSLHQMFNPAYNLSFADFLHGSAADHDSFSGAFAQVPPTSSEAFTEMKPAVCGAGETPATPNSSISSSSTEAAVADGDSGKSKKEAPAAFDREDASKKE